MGEEAEALLHSSKTTNKALKCLLTMTLFLIISFIEWGCVNGVIDGFEDGQFL
jgi:tetrahydromethanopterin S-methyltransferase subunit D